MKVFTGFEPSPTYIDNASLDKLDISGRIEPEINGTLQHTTTLNKFSKQLDSIEKDATALSEEVLVESTNLQKLRSFKEKLDTIKNDSDPTNLQKLRSFKEKLDTIKNDSDPTTTSGLDN